MKLIHAVTASDLANSGQDYSLRYLNWTRIGQLPIYMAVNETSRVVAWGVEGLRFYGSYVHFTLPVGQGAVSQWKPGEVIACGHYLAPYNTSSRLPNVSTPALSITSSAGVEGLFTFADIYPYTADGLASYIEYVGSYDMKTWSLYVNGKFARSVQSLVTHDRESLVFFYHNSSNLYIYYTMKDVYAAVFDPAIEKPYLGAWSCDELVMTGGDFPNAALTDSVVDLLSEDSKSIEFTYAGSQKLIGVTVSGTLKGIVPEVLDTLVVSGEQQRTTTLPQTPTSSSTEMLAKNTGIAVPLGSVDFDNESKKVTATLKLKTQVGI